MRTTLQCSSKALSTVRLHPEHPVTGSPLPIYNEADMSDDHLYVTRLIGSTYFCQRTRCVYQTYTKTWECFSWLSSLEGFSLLQLRHIMLTLNPQFATLFPTQLRRCAKALEHSQTLHHLFIGVLIESDSSFNMHVSVYRQTYGLSVDWRRLSC